MKYCSVYVCVPITIQPFDGRMAKSLSWGVHHGVRSMSQIDLKKKRKKHSNIIKFPVKAFESFLSDYDCLYCQGFDKKKSNSGLIEP